ncbi:phytanoyl-CoA dioxygenase family protein [Thalassomonas haliotis]|uniref:Phytanoyl-CoA dioxygenase family protein n=1 Tax=Thalassomonas haliotis TaxID=485448 RepID=A0ABY7VPN0_9GAMM|nr:phytanoyl-CoA dioxygenase family protein [Thalassomonas haliotis]WDE14307.1 phytanoyl-CoA dioxygenase family protein [Thalassomonas haliotis]
MDFTRLTTEQQKAFDCDGFLVVAKALSKQQVNALTQITDHKARAFLDKYEVPLRAEYNQLDLRPGLLKYPETIALITNASTVPLVTQLLSPNIHLHSTALIYKRPSDPGLPPMRRGWHRDIRIPRDLGHKNLPRVGIKICYCLTDFHEKDSGLTLLARGSQELNNPLLIPEGEVDPQGLEVCDLKLNAGDAFLFDNRIYHTASPNRSKRVSKVLMFGYAYRWMKPEVYLDNPDQKFLRRFDPVTRQLLGGYTDIDTPAWALQAWAKQHKVSPKPVPWQVETHD